MKKRKKKKINILNLILTIITTIFLIILKITNIMPNKYYLLLLITILILTIIILILVKKKKLLGYILNIILILLYTFGGYYLSITKNYLSSLNKNHYSEEIYLVIIPKEKNYTNIKELDKKSIGYYSNSIKDITSVLNKLQKKVSTKQVEYKDYEHLFNDLDNNKIEAILLEENYYNIKTEEEEENNYKILYKIKIRTLITNKTKKVDITKDPFTIYISGIDTYGNIETISRSDVNILITVNPNTKQVLLTSIPRDSYVKLSGTSGLKDKLTHAGNYGVNMSINTIKELLNIDINYYIRVNFTTLEKIIDSIKGIDVYSEYSFISYIDNYQFYKGFNHMNGKEALAFSRERKSLPNGDIDRGKNQEAVIEAIIRKITSKEIINNYQAILKNTKDTFQTNFTNKEITTFIKKELENLGGWTVTSTAITGTGSLEYTYSYPNQKLYVMNIDKKSQNNTIELINKVINNEKLDSSYTEAKDIKVPNKITKPTKDEPKTETKEKNNNEETAPKETEINNNEETTLKEAEETTNKEQESTNNKEKNEEEANTQNE